MKTTATPAQRQSRPRDREKTKKELELAILRVKNKGLKMSIVAVASEAGVTPSLIHNTYSDIVEKIRTLIGKATREQRDAKAAELAEARATLRALREELRLIQRDFAKLASINETLREEIAVLRAKEGGKVRLLPCRESR